MSYIPASQKMQLCKRRQISQNSSKSFCSFTIVCTQQLIVTDWLTSQTVFPFSVSLNVLYECVLCNNIIVYFSRYIWNPTWWKFEVYTMTAIGWMWHYAQDWPPHVTVYSRIRSCRVHSLRKILLISLGSLRSRLLAFPNSHQNIDIPTYLWLGVVDI